MAVRLARASKQPRLPQLHLGPPTSMTMCPISPAVPLKPEYNLPSTIMPPPMPVPMKMPIMWRGLDCSSFSKTPSVALLQSFSTETGTPNCFSRIFFSGTSCHCRFGAKMTRPVVGIHRAGRADADAAHLLEVQIAFIHRVAHATGDAFDDLLRRRARTWCSFWCGPGS